MAGTDAVIALLFALPAQAGSGIVWTGASVGTEVAAHSARRAPNRQVRFSPAIRGGFKLGIGPTHSALIDLSGSVGELQGSRYAGAIGSLGTRIVVPRGMHIDLLLGMSVGGESDWGPVAVFGFGMRWGDASVDMRLRLPSALMDGSFFVAGCRTPGPCIATAQYIPDRGTLGMSVEMGALFDPRRRPE